MPRWRNVLLRTGSSQQATLRMIYFFHICTHTVTFSDINLSVNLLGGLIYILTKTGLSHQSRNRENEASLKRINLCHRPHPPQSCVTLRGNSLISLYRFSPGFFASAHAADRRHCGEPFAHCKTICASSNKSQRNGKQSKKKKNTRRERPHSSHGKHVEKRIFFFCRFFFLRARNRRCGFKV